MNKSSLYPIVTFGLALVVGAMGADAQPDTTAVRQRVESVQRVVAQTLLTTLDEAERSHLVDQISSVQVTDMIPELRSALTQALRNENLTERDRARRARRGEVLRDQADPELRLKLVRIVVSFNDPTSIDALAGAVETGGRAVNGIADFGVQAVPALLAVVAADSADQDVVSGALCALRYITEDHSTEIPAAQRQQIRNAAMIRLTSPQQFASPVLAAVDLALADGDPALRARVNSLRAQPAQAFAGGASAGVGEEWLRQRIDARFRGEPALPVRKSLRR